MVKQRYNYYFVQFNIPDEMVTPIKVAVER